MPATFNDMVCPPTKDWWGGACKLPHSENSLVTLAATVRDTNKACWSFDNTLRILRWVLVAKSALPAVALKVVATTLGEFTLMNLMKLLWNMVKTSQRKAFNHRNWEYGNGTYIYIYTYNIYICWGTKFDTPIILWQYDWMPRTVQWSYLKFCCFWAPWVLYRQYAVVSTGGPWKRFPGPSGIWSNMEYPRKLWNPPILGYLQMRFSKIISLFSLHIGPWASQNLHMLCEHTPGWFTFSWTSKCCQLNTKGWWINTLKRNHLAPIWRCRLAGIFTKISKDDTKADAGRRLMRAAVISLWCLC